MTSNRKIISLDVGDARTGVAITDNLGLTAQPFTTIEHKTLKELFVHIKKIIIQHKIAEIVIGLPLEMSGIEGKRAEKIRKLGQKLKTFLKNDINLEENTPTNKVTEKNETFIVLPNIVFWDERLTTNQAEKIVIGSKLKNKEKSSALDRVSATIILQAYLESKLQPILN